MSYIYLNRFLGVTNTFKSIFKDGYFYSYSSTFLVIKKYFYFITATLLSLLYLNAIQVKNASINSKCAVYFSLGKKERCPFANYSFF